MTTSSSDRCDRSFDRPSEHGERLSSGNGLATVYDVKRNAFDTGLDCLLHVVDGALTLIDVVEKRVCFRFGKAMKDSDVRQDVSIVDIPTVQEIRSEDVVRNSAGGPLSLCMPDERVRIDCGVHTCDLREVERKAYLASRRFDRREQAFGTLPVSLRQRRPQVDPVSWDVWIEDVWVTTCDDVQTTE